MEKKVYIHIKIKEELREKLRDEAEEKGISLNAYVNLIFSKRERENEK